MLFLVHLGLVGGSPLVSPDLLAAFVQENCGDRLVQKCGRPDDPEVLTMFVKAALRCEGGDLRPCVALIPDQAFVACASQVQEDWSTCYPWESSPIQSQCSYSQPCHLSAMTELVHLRRLPGRSFVCQADAQGTAYTNVCVSKEKGEDQVLDPQVSQTLGAPDFQDCCEGACQKTLSLHSVEPGLEVCVTTHGRVCLGACPSGGNRQQCSMAYHMLNCAKGQCFHVEHPWSMGPTSEIRVGPWQDTLRIEYLDVLNADQERSRFAMEIRLKTKDARLILGTPFKPTTNFRLGCQLQGNPLFCSDNLSWESLRHEFTKQKVAFFSEAPRATCLLGGPPVCRGQLGSPDDIGVTLRKEPKGQPCEFYGFLPGLANKCETAQAVEEGGQCLVQETQLCVPPDLTGLRENCLEFQKNRKRRALTNAQADDSAQLKAEVYAQLLELTDEKTARTAVDAMFRGLPHPEQEDKWMTQAHDRLSAYLKDNQMEHLTDKVYRIFQAEYQQLVAARTQNMNAQNAAAAGNPRPRSQTRALRLPSPPPAPAKVQANPNPNPNSMLPTSLQITLMQSRSVTAAPTTSTTTLLIESPKGYLAGGFLMGILLPGILLFCLVSVICGLLCFGLGFKQNMGYAPEPQGAEIIEQVAYEEGGYYYEDEYIDDLEDGEGGEEEEGEYEAGDYEEDPEAAG